MKRSSSPNTVLAKVKAALENAKGTVSTFLLGLTPNKSTVSSINRFKNAFQSDFESGVSVSIGTIALPKSVMQQVELDIHRGKVSEARSRLLTAIAASREELRVSELRLRLLNKVWDSFASGVETAFDGIDLPSTSTRPEQSLEDILAMLDTDPATLASATK